VSPLVTERLMLRPWEERDRQPLVELQCNARVRRFFPSLPTPEQVSDDFDAALEKARLNGFHFGSARLRSNDSFVGLLGLGVVPDIARDAIASRPRVEIGWVLNPSFWGRGLASEGARAWLDFAWSLALPEVVAFTAALNKPSQRVMERLGMMRDPADDFLHPRIEAGHPLRPHVLYRIVSPASRQ
jgi:RimJ/RimL family protein N-acetyltransferase